SLGAVTIAGDLFHLDRRGGVGCKKFGETFVLFFRFLEDALDGFEFAGCFFAGGICAIDFDRQLAARLRDPHPFAFQILGGAREFETRAIAGGFEMAILHLQQDVAPGNALAGLDFDALDSAFEAHANFGDGSFDGRFTQDDVIVTVTSPGNCNGHHGGSDQEDHDDDKEADAKCTDLARRGSGFRGAGGLRVWFVHEAGARRAFCDYSRHPCSLTLRPPKVSASGVWILNPGFFVLNLLKWNALESWF